MRKIFLDFRVPVELTPLIQIDIFVRRGWGVFFEEMTKPVYRTGFGDAGFTVETSQEEVTKWMRL